MAYSIEPLRGRDRGKTLDGLDAARGILIGAALGGAIWAALLTTLLVASGVLSS